LSNFLRGFFNCQPKPLKLFRILLNLYFVIPLILDVFKRKILLALLVLIAVWLSTAAFSYAQNFKNHKLGAERTGLTVLSSGRNKILLRTIVGNLNTSEAETVEGDFTIITADGHYFGGEEGQPQLPVQNKLFIIPPGTTPVARVVSYVEKDIDLKELGIKSFLMPRQPSLPKREISEKIKFQYDRKVYKKDDFIGNELLQIEVLGTMRGNQIGRISISPVLYNPVQKKLKLAAETEIEINFVPDGTPPKSYSPPQSGPYDEFIFRNFLNSPQNMLKSSGLSGGPMKYIILSDPMFRDALVPFIEWKTKKGFDVIEVYKGEDGVGTTNTAMRDYLKGIYDNSLPDSPPVFLLIVGDHEQIPAFSASGHVTDLYYAEYDGDGDYFPELFYGRFSAQTIEQLIPQVEKTMMYEKYGFPDPSFLDEVVMIAGVDGSYAPAHGNGHINYAVNNYLNEEFSILSHTYLYPESGQSALPIIQHISNGAGFVNYTGHGSTDRWESPLFHISSIDTLQNTGKYPLVIGNGCQTVRFNVPVSLGEAFLRAEGKGAVGYIGGTNDTYWNEDYYWAVGLGPIVSNPGYEETGLGMFDRTFYANGEPDEVWATTQGQMVQAGNMAVTESASRVKFYWEVYHLMGDPSLMTYFSQATTQNPEYSQQIPIGTERLVVQAEPYSYVALSGGTVLFDAKHTNQAGIAELNFPALTETGSASLVVTKNQRQPYIANIDIADFAEAYVVYHSHAIDDAGANNNGVAESGETFSLDLTIKNLGTVTSGKLTLMLSTEDPYVSVSSGSEEIMEIEAGFEINLSQIFEMAISSIVHDKHQALFLLLITDEFSNEWQSQFLMEIRSPEISIQNAWFEDISGGRINLRAGQRGFLKIMLENSGGAASENVVSTLSSENPLIQIPVSSLMTGSFQPGVTVILEFEVELPEDFPYGISELFLLDITSENYEAQKSLMIYLNGLFEDFESDSFSFLPWVNESPVSWTILGTGGLNNSLSARSGKITHNQTSSLFVQMNVSEPSEISFWLKVSSEKNWDFLRFFINEDEVMKWSGAESWKKVSFPVNPGINEFRWTYTKDGSISSGEDAAGLDDILFPDGLFIGNEDIVDLGVISVLKPVSGDEMTGFQVVEIEVKNFGNLPASNFPLFYRINSSPAVQETMTDELLPGETKVYEFITTGDFSAKGNYYLEVFTNHIADANRSNDTLKLTIVHLDPSGIGDTYHKKEIHIFPNPASNYVNIKVPDELYGKNLNIRLTDLAGRIIREKKISSATEINVMNLSGITSGYYHISVIYSNESYSSGLYIY
jgi:hypothetical protein